MTKTLIEVRPQDIKTADNVRTDLGNIVELANSILAHGLENPPTVDADGVLITGHRRVQACVHLVKGGFMPKDWTIQVLQNGTEGDTDRISRQIIENIQRKDLDIWEEAEAYGRLRDLGVKQKEIAASVGMSQSHISRRLLVLNVPEDVRSQLTDATPEDLEHIAKGFKLDPEVARILFDQLEEQGWGYGRYENFDLRIAKLLAEYEATKTLTEAGKTVVDKIDYNHEVNRITDPGPTDFESIPDDAEVHVSADHEGKAVLTVVTKPEPSEKKSSPEDEKLKAARALLREVKAGRKEFIEAQLKRKPTNADALAYLSAEIINGLTVTECQQVAKFLGAPEPTEVTSGESLSLYCDDPVKLAMTALVLTNEKKFNDPHAWKYWGDHHHQQWMESRGYKPGKDEKKWAK